MSTLADAALLHLCIDFVIFLVSWKKTHRWRPTNCAILHFLIKYLLCKWRPLFKYSVCKDINFPRKKNKNMCANQLFSFFVADSCDTNEILYYCQRIKQGFIVFWSSLSEYIIKYSWYTSWSIDDWTAHRNETFGNLMFRN